MILSSYRQPSAAVLAVLAVLLVVLLVVVGVVAVVVLVDSSLALTPCQLSFNVPSPRMKKPRRRSTPTGHSRVFRTSAYKLVAVSFSV